MNFKINTSKEAVQEQSGGSYISKSGIYDASINFASIGVASTGSESVNFNITNNGNSQTIYGPYVTNKDGDPLEIGLKLINKLGIIVGMGEGDELETDTETHNVGKDNKPQEFQVITNFSDTDIKIRLQEEYGINPKTNQIRKAMVIKNFYRADGASAEEIVNDSEIGVQMAKDEAYASNITYKNDLTAADIEAWKAEKASGDNASAPKAKASPKKPAGSLFK